jgi:hypothetical protein
MAVEKLNPKKHAHLTHREFHNLFSQETAIVHLAKPGSYENIKKPPCPQANP